MSLNIHLPENPILKPCITVFGVGGAGCNAVNNMILSGLEGARFVVANTDAQSLEHSEADKRIQLGETITRGLGAGASPDVGRAGAEESIASINEYLEGSNLVFITAGMGGGTGTGAAPVIAKAAREKGILTVAVVTKPFHFEGVHRMKIAEAGLLDLQNYVDTLIVIPNQNLFRIANERTTFADAFKMADDVLKDGVRSVTDLMIMPGLINLDFADVKSVMSEMGKAMMGSGEAEGENRAIVAAEAAISNPLLDNSSMKGANGVLINITGGMDMTLFEVDAAANRIREEVDPDANIIFGSAFNEALSGKIRVSVVATGIEDNNNDYAGKPKMTHAQKTLMSYRAPAREEDNITVTEKTEKKEKIDNKILENHPDENEGFVMPKPEVFDEDNEVQNNINNVKEQDHKQVHARKKPQSLFSKMISSVGFGSSNKDDYINNKSKTEYQTTDHPIQTTENQLINDDLDIPAYHRRKK
jgi:cell division protein FtsZ